MNKVAFNVFKIGGFRKRVMRKIYDIFIRMNVVNKFSKWLIKNSNYGFAFNVDSILTDKFSGEEAKYIKEFLENKHPTLSKKSDIYKYVRKAINISEHGLAEVIYKNAIKRGVLPELFTENSYIPEPIRSLFLANGDINSYLQSFKYSTKNRLLNQHIPQKWSPPSKIEENIFSSKKIAILATLGPGDELSSSVVYGYMLKDKRINPKNISITCDHRLAKIFQRTYPEFDFIETRLCRNLNKNYKYEFYDQLPHINLHKLLDNDAFKRVMKSDHLMLNLSVMSLYQQQISQGEIFRYLKPDQNLVEKFRGRFNPGYKYIGLSWKSSILNIVRNHSSNSIESFAPIFKVPGIRFVNLQYSDSQEEQKWMERHYPGKLLSFNDVDLYNDFESFIAIMHCLEAVITPPTSVAQIASKSGCKTLLLCNSKITARPITLGTIDPHMIPLENCIQIKGKFIGDKISTITRLEEYILQNYN